MKLINVMYVLFQAAAVIAVGFFVALVCMFSGFYFDGAVVVGILVVWPLAIVVFLMNFYGNPLTKFLMKKTIEKNAAAQGFTNCSTFNSLYGVIKIDVKGGKFAIVSAWNPTEFQVGSAAKIENVVSDYVKCPFGGTTGVYFQFMYEKTRIRCYTFTTNRNPYSLESTEVLEGQSKADAYAELLKQAKEVATTVA